MIMRARKPGEGIKRAFDSKVSGIKKAMSKDRVVPQETIFAITLLSSHNSLLAVRPRPVEAGLRGSVSTRASKRASVALSIRGGASCVALIVLVLLPLFVIRLKGYA